MSRADFRATYGRYRSIVEKRLDLLLMGNGPESVYGPVRYVLSSGGKRLRAALVLFCCDAVGGRIRNAVDAAAAVEILHNFTLVHDDVMDHADLRRGKATVHRRWDENVAILAGDELVAQAYRTLLRTKLPNEREVLKVFTDAFVTVCEGQGLDKEFESRRKVSLPEYFVMIGRKTAAMMAAACEIGALAGGETSAQRHALRRYGYHLGIAFQIQDDLLDISGEGKEFGKKIGGDIIEGKKTYLLLTALERVRGRDREILRSIRPGLRVPESMIARVRGIYERTGALKRAEGDIADQLGRAKEALGILQRSVPKARLDALADALLGRES